MASSVQRHPKCNPDIMSVYVGNISVTCLITFGDGGGGAAEGGKIDHFFFPWRNGP
jgi:hypothetical protein